MESIFYEPSGQAHAQECSLRGARPQSGVRTKGSPGTQESRTGAGPSPDARFSVGRESASSLHSAEVCLLIVRRRVLLNGLYQRRSEPDRRFQIALGVWELLLPRQLGSPSMGYFDLSRSDPGEEFFSVKPDSSLADPNQNTGKTRNSSRVCTIGIRFLRRFMSVGVRSRGSCLESSISSKRLLGLRMGTPDAC